MTTENMFDTYWTTLAGVLGYPVTKRSKPTKQTAIRLCGHPIPLGPEMFQRLHNALRNEGWSKCTGSNWRWRSETPACDPASSKEIRLERAVATGREETWICQMSTASGVQDGHPNKRRAIDLVKHVAPGHFAFIELKVDSDNPVHAAFELLSYALAYLHARDAGRTCRSEMCDVMDAEKIDLIVLGPDDWFTYAQGRGNSVGSVRVKS